jgi:hypothetical protein
MSEVFRGFRQVYLGRVSASLRWHIKPLLCQGWQLTCRLVLRIKRSLWWRRVQSYWLSFWRNFFDLQICISLSDYNFLFLRAKI